MLNRLDKHADRADGQARADEHFPRHVERQLRAGRRGHLAEPRGRADAEAEADRAHQQRLQQDHAISDQLPAPIALSAPYCLRFSIVNR